MLLIVKAYDLSEYLSLLLVCACVFLIILEKLLQLLRNCFQFLFKSRISGLSARISDMIRYIHPFLP